MNCRGDLLVVSLYVDLVVLLTWSSDNDVFAFNASLDLYALTLAMNKVL